MDRELGRLSAGLEASLLAAGQPLAAIIDALAEAVTVRDLNDRIIYANRAALERLGLDSLDDVRTADPGAIMDNYLVEGEDGGEINMDDIPSVRLLRGESVEPLLMRTVSRTTGEEAWVLLKAAPLHNADGVLAAAITIIEDVTAAKRAEQRIRFLARASEILASSLDYQETLRNVAWLAVPEIADWCSVDLVDGHRQREQVAVAHPDPVKLELAQRLRQYDPEELDPEQGLGRVVRTNESELYADIPDELLREAAIDDEHLELLRALGMHSVMLVPMRVGKAAIGAMTLVSAESPRRFDQADLEFAEQLAGRAAVAVENSRLYTARSRIAETLQRSLLPEALPAVDGWEIAALYRPAEAGLEVGGDFYDVFAAGGGWLVVIGDVTGKGVQAAAMTSLVRHGARIIGEDDPDPARILARLDLALRQNPTLSLSSALCLRLDRDGVTFSSAGHPLPLVCSAEAVRDVGEPGPLLGAFDDGRWHNQELSLAEDEVLLLYTDGVSDTLGHDGRFGHDRLRALVADCGPIAPSDMLDCIDTGLTEFQAGAQADDTAALALRRAQK